MDIVRVAAIALAKSGPQNDDVLRALVDFSHDKKDTIRCGAAEALGYLIAPPAVDRLKEILQADVNARVRAAAAHGLGHTLDARVIQFIRETTARDKSHVVKTAGLDAIREIQDNEDRNR
jgi:HEAT repeat protein